MDSDSAEVFLWCTADLVFIQNGMLEPWLNERGLADNTQAGALSFLLAGKEGFAIKRPFFPNLIAKICSSSPASLKFHIWIIMYILTRNISSTQVLVYFAVAKKGDAPTDGKTELNPEGLTAAYGKHAQTFAERLATQDLSCKVVPRLHHYFLRAFHMTRMPKLDGSCGLGGVGRGRGVGVGSSLGYIL